MHMIKTSVRLDQRNMNAYIRRVGDAAIDNVYEAMEKVQKKTRKIYKDNTRHHKRISSFLHTERQKTKKNVLLSAEVNAKWAQRSGVDLEGKDVDIWNSIAYQTEYGVLRNKRSFIYPKRGRVMAIPVSEEAKEKGTPRKFPHGKWIRYNNQPLFVTLTRGGSFHKPVPPIIDNIEGNEI